MSFINGLKIFFKRPIYVIILVLFILSWFLILFGRTFISIPRYALFVFFFIAVLAGFNFVLIIVSIFKPIRELKYYLIIAIFLISLPIVLLFKSILNLFYLFCLIANQVLTAFFAFKLCMDSSTKVDDFLYDHKKSRIFTRLLEFLFFGFAGLMIFLFTWNFLRRFTPAIAKSSANIFRIIFWVDVILIIIVVTRWIVIKKLAAYITLFFILTFFYILYIIIDIVSEVLLGSSSFAWYIFIFDLALFIYIIGSIFDKVEYLEGKLKYIKVETISFFVILMKLVAQFVKLFPAIPGFGAADLLTQQLFLLLIVLITFIGCILFFGIHSIIVHKEGKNKDTEEIKELNKE
jgi:hypothetical protein